MASACCGSFYAGLLLIHLTDSSKYYSKERRQVRLFRASPVKICVAALSSLANCWTGSASAISSASSSATCWTGPPSMRPSEKEGFQDTSTPLARPHARAALTHLSWHLYDGLGEEDVGFSEARQRWGREILAICEISWQAGDGAGSACR